MRFNLQPERYKGLGEIYIGRTKQQQKHSARSVGRSDVAKFQSLVFKRLPFVKANDEFRSLLLSLFFVLFFFQKPPTQFVLPQSARSSVSHFIIPSVNKTCQQSRQSSIRSDEGLTLETPVLQDFHSSNSIFSNSFDIIEFSCFTLPSTQHHSFFINYKFVRYQSISQLEIIVNKLVTQSMIE